MIVVQNGPGGLEFALKQLKRQVDRDGIRTDLTRRAEPKRSIRRRNKHQRHLRLVAQGKR